MYFPTSDVVLIEGHGQTDRFLFEFHRKYSLCHGNSSNALISSAGVSTVLGEVQSDAHILAYPVNYGLQLRLIKIHKELICVRYILP